MKSPAIKDLRDLKVIARDLERQARAQAEQAAAALQVERLRLAQEQLFVRAVGPVRSLPAKHLSKAVPRTERPAPLTADLAGASRAATALLAAWDGAARAEAEALARVTLADLAARSREPGQTMYYI